MTILGQGDWDALELAAQTHELNHVDTPPVPSPTQAQHLLWATVELAQARAKIHRMQQAISEAMMYQSIAEHGRAREVLARAFIDL